MSASGAEMLRGRRILVVEDEWLVATDLAESLEQAGAEVIGPAGSIGEALALINGAGTINGAVLDINLRGERVFPVAEALRGRDIPFVFVTGYDQLVVPPAFADAPRYEKPVNTAVLVPVLVAHMR